MNYTIFCAAIMHLSAINPHVQTILELQASKSGGGQPSWHAPRQASGALHGTAGLLTGVSSFAFQGTNAHALVQAAVAAAAVPSAGADANWAHQRVWVAPPANALLQLVASSGSSQRRQHAAFESFLATPRLSFLWQHVVKGLPLAPAAAFLEAASAAAGSLLNATELAGTVLAHALFVTPVILRGHQGGAKVSSLKSRRFAALPCVLGAFSHTRTHTPSPLPPCAAALLGQSCGGSH